LPFSGDQRAATPGRIGSGVFPPLPLPDARSSDGKSSLRLRLPSRVLPLHHRKLWTLLEKPKGLKSNDHLRLPRFRPLQRFPSHGEPLNPVRSHLIRLRCALRVSHPLDALLPPWPAGHISSQSRSWGLPFGALLPPAVPYVLSDAATLMELARASRRLASPPGFRTPPGIPPERPGV
jgi:hypothetical protein